VLVPPGRRLELTGDGVRPLLEAGAIPRRDAEHLRDHNRRQRVGDRRHDVDAALAGLVQQFVDHGLDARAHALHLARRERPVHQRPQTGVIGRVQPQQARLLNRSAQPVARRVIEPGRLQQSVELAELALAAVIRRAALVA
jgi:hypothetical protein